MRGTALFHRPAFSEIFVCTVHFIQYDHACERHVARRRVTAASNHGSVPSMISFGESAALNSLPRCGMLRVFHVEHCWREVGKLFNQSCALRLFRVTMREFSHISPPHVPNGRYSKGNHRVRSTPYQSRFVLTNMVPGRTTSLSGRQLSEKHARCAITKISVTVFHFCTHIGAIRKRECPESSAVFHSLTTLILSY